MDSEFLIPHSINDIIKEIRNRCTTKVHTVGISLRHLRFYKKFKFEGKSLKVKVSYDKIIYESKHKVKAGYTSEVTDVLETNLIIKLNKTNREKMRKLFYAPLGEIEKTIKYVDGDLLKLNFDVIVHGCNCHQTMGSGIAVAIKEKHPEAWVIDRECTLKPKQRLGTIKYTVLQTDPIVVNAYTQFNFGRDKINADYKAIRSCMKEIKKTFSGKSIGLPQIGAGLAGGDWNIIENIIEEELSGENVTVVIFKQS